MASGESKVHEELERPSIPFCFPTNSDWVAVRGHFMIPCKTPMAAPSTSLPPLANFDDYNTQLQGAALTATRNAVFLPSDLGFYRSMDRAIAKEVDTCSSRVLSLTSRLLDLVSTGNSSTSKSKGKVVLDHDDVIDNFRYSVVDPMDRLLERADICLDNVLGLTKQPLIAVNPQAPKQKDVKKTVSATGRLDPALLHASHLPKPQLKFSRKLNYDASCPWHPKLRHKYNAKVPLGYDLRDDENVQMDTDSLYVDCASVHPEYRRNLHVYRQHPYHYEIKNITYPPHMFVYGEPIPPKSFETTPFKWVESPAELSAMLEHLRNAKEIAVDLEYHSYRSFAGFVCLMQISTRESDWIVDTLTLRQELEDLNEVFTDPNIVKVLHGAESDVIWLQQDFNLYIVNLFDTYHASKVLEFPRHALATLMEMYCDFIPDKRYQLADWRIRPLPQEMLKYARSDTHFLLFIYDNLRNALIDRAQSRSASRAQSPSSPLASTSISGENSHTLVRDVLSRSQDTTLRVFEREIYDAENGSGPGGWDTLARKWNKGALMAAERDSSRRRVYRAMHAWRDYVAREEDESTRYVLPNHQLFSLVEQPPSDMASLLSMFQHVPAIVRRRAKELLDTIREASKDTASVEVVAVPEASDVVMGAIQESKETMHEVVLLANDSRLWPSGRKTARIVSSLFPESRGTMLGPASRNGKLFMTSHSALFPGKMPSETSVDLRKQRVQDVHGRLVTGPAAPSITLPPKVADSASAESARENIPGQAEMPFVPAKERQEINPAAVVTTVKDAIVVVGQPQGKKRKRDKKAAGSSVVAMPRAESEIAAASTPFDYTAVSNILDDGSDHEPETTLGGGRKRKQKHKAQGQPEQGGFRAPPKAPSEVRRGNQSRTFK
ncbi:ribonuclease H-like domain-containing protein [Cytidiella melzeri]|nr:ribonuclease H-like domain-containing protein [Cytidiella melzeri]